jgi:surface antigen
MFKSALVGISVLSFIAVISNSADVNALDLAQTNSIKLVVIEPIQTPLLVADGVEIIEPEVEVPETKYVVQESDSLSKIATAHNTTWRRIYDKNSVITNPDVITVGMEFVIPTADEVIAERSLPEPVIVAIEAKPEVPSKKPVSRAAVTRASSTLGSSSGNLYVPGYCTWYVKNKRPDLPNNLGNADTWVSRAAAQGLATGSTPRVGAVGQRGMHVVYVESVNSDNTVTISEMNHKGLYVTTVRTLPSDYFRYIY